MLFRLYLSLFGWWRVSAWASSLICLSKKCPWLMSYGVMKLIIGHRDQCASGRGQWGTTLRRNVVPQWLGPCTVWPIECCNYRSIQQTWRFEIIFLFRLMTGLYVDFPLHMQISNSMHYFTSLEVSWLIHAADWKWPLRKILIIQLTHVSCWSQVMDPCLPFLRFTDWLYMV